MNRRANLTVTAVAGLLAAAVAVITPLASATTMIRLTLEEMTQRATDVVVGTVSRVESRWTEDHEQILTYVTVSNTERLKGDLQGDVTFVQLGGQVDDHLMFVVGAPQFAADQEVAVFLTRMVSAKRLSVNADRWLLGLSQGVWRITTDQTGRRIAVADSAEVHALDRPGVYQELRMDAPGFKQRVRDAAADVRGIERPALPTSAPQP